MTYRALVGRIFFGKEYFCKFFAAFSALVVQNRHEKPPFGAIQSLHAHSVLLKQMHILAVEFKKIRKDEATIQSCGAVPRGAGQPAEETPVQWRARKLTPRSHLQIPTVTECIQDEHG
jgi:hypothetical protein